MRWTRPRESSPPTPDTGRPTRSSKREPTALDTLQRVLLQATDFSPEIVPLAEKPKSPRYFEIRVYHSPTQRQLGAVHERFIKAEISIFHRSGVNPILYADTVIGPEMPNLTYIVPFANLAEREKAWDTFLADPEWVKVRAESVARDGQIVNFQNITLLARHGLFAHPVAVGPASACPAAGRPEVGAFSRPGGLSMAVTRSRSIERNAGGPASRGRAGWRFRELIWLLAAALLVAGHLYLVYQAKSRPLAEIEQGLASKKLLNLKIWARARTSCRP